MFIAVRPGSSPQSMASIPAETKRELKSGILFNTEKPEYVLLEIFPNKSSHPTNDITKTIHQLVGKIASQPAKPESLATPTSKLEATASASSSIPNASLGEESPDPHPRNKKFKSAATVPTEYLEKSEMYTRRSKHDKDAPPFPAHCQGEGCNKILPSYALVGDRTGKVKCQRCAQPQKGT